MAITIDRTTLQIVFDIGVNSLAFECGWLNDEDVAALRTIAVELGVDPMTATPKNFKCKYTGKHEPLGPEYKFDAKMCRNCKTIVD